MAHMCFIVQLNIFVHFFIDGHCCISGEDVQQERQPLKLPYVPEPTALERRELLRDLHAANTHSSVLTVSSGFQDEFFKMEIYLSPLWIYGMTGI
ncbi:hypothetical protein DPMN_158584 [Dreissena polymorpha]|uniref:Uncharacterized protein n=1 Tax=Dreissena polymorpha TaxID=45954 RepID=A0A9D4EI37_DREPO|nr:hypothetical protein DPMN_158584 [Dreissena polymorpha]